MSNPILAGYRYAGTPDGDTLLTPDGALLLLPGFGDQPGPPDAPAPLTGWAPIPETEPYTQALLALLPHGLAWSRDPESWLGRLLAAIGAPLARVQAAAEAVAAEADPRQALMLLPDYEALLGLPGPCATELADTIAERRLHVWARWTAAGGATPAYLIGLAAQLGYAVTIEEFEASEVGVFAADDELIGAEALHCFVVHTAGTEGFDFTADDGCADEPLGDFVRQDLLECAIRRARPAHTWAGFAYTLGATP